MAEQVQKLTARNNDLNRARELIDELGTPYNAGKIFNQRLASAGIDYQMDKSGMSRIYKGEAKPALIAFVVLILSSTD